MIAHALELVRHVQEAEDLAQIAGNRSLGEDHRQAVLVDLRMARIDRAVGGDDPRRDVHVPVDEGTGGVGDGDVDHLTHLQDQVAHLPLLALQRGAMRVGQRLHQPNRPVM